MEDCPSQCIALHINMCTLHKDNSLLREVSLYRTAYCGPNGVLIREVSLYRTAYCGPNGVLIVEVSLYRTAYCGPNGVLIVKVSLYAFSICGRCLSSLMAVHHLPLYC